MKKWSRVSQLLCLYLACELVTNWANFSATKSRCSCCNKLLLLLLCEKAAWRACLADNSCTIHPFVIQNTTCLSFFLLSVESNSKETLTCTLIDTWTLPNNDNYNDNDNNHRPSTMDLQEDSFLPVTVYILGEWYGNFTGQKSVSSFVSVILLESRIRMRNCDRVDSHDYSSANLGRWFMRWMMNER